MVVGGDAFRDRDGGLSIAPVLRSQVTPLVLGLVIEQPSHGYEIAQRFERRFGAFLPTKKASIYDALKVLVEARLIERMIESTQSIARRDVKPYRATKEGGRSYRAWLAGEVRSDPQRVAMLGRLTLAGARTADDALEFLDRYEQECLRDATALDLRSERDASGVSGVMELLLLEEQKRVLDARLGWIRYAKVMLRREKERSDSSGEEQL